MPYGRLASLLILDAPFEEITLDFIRGLPPCKLTSGIDVTVYDSILVVVDRYTKRARYVAARKDWTALQFADAMHRHIFCTDWGTPRGIVSDRGVLFTSNVWSEMCY